MTNTIELFSGVQISGSLELNIRRLNPWWEGKPLPILPKTRRHIVKNMKQRLDRRLAPIVVVRGPRQIGKTTAQLQFIHDLLSSGISPRHIFRMQFDELPELINFKCEEPILRIIDWYEKNILKQSINQAAHAGQNIFLFFDEVQNLSNWAPQLKFLVDSSTVNALVTGSSALRIELGRDSLAGRITTIETGVLSLTEIAQFWDIPLGNPIWEENGLEPITQKEFWLSLKTHGEEKFKERDSAFSKFSQLGGYPLAHNKKDVSWAYIADQLNETVIQRVIQHDLRIGDRGRKRDAPLLEELFRLACRYAGQSPSLQLLARETQRALHANVGSQRVNNYLRFLGETLLLRLIDPLEIRLKKKKGSQKICLADHGLRASWLQELVPLDPIELRQQDHLTTLAGHIAESVVGAVLSTISGLDLAHYPERNGEPEIDFVLTVGAKRIPLEVKYQRRIDQYSDTEGLRSFIEKTVNNAPFGILITQADGIVIEDPRIIAIPLSTLMLLK
jgi:predicted AAA+ superfamily ATPase